MRVIRNPGVLEQVAVGGGTFAGRRVEQHFQIHPFTDEFTIVLRNDGFDQQDRGGESNPGGAMSKPIGEHPRSFAPCALKCVSSRLPAFAPQANLSSRLLVS